MPRGQHILCRRHRTGAQPARAVTDVHPTLTATAGATSPNAQIVVVRLLAPQKEPAMKLKAVRVAWGEVLWALEGEARRILAM